MSFKVKLEGILWACLSTGYHLGGGQKDIDGYLDDIEKILEKDNLRYEKLRKLNPRQFAELYNINLKTGKPFDELVDELE